MITKEWTRPASSGEGEIFSRLWADESPRAVIVIAHGMAEHSGRYEELGTFLARNGFAAAMNDHAGHGRSIRTQGFFAEQNGWEHVVTDLKALLEDMKRDYPGLPLFLLGHSMGSFLSRSFLTRWGNELSGCILCGTMGKNPALGMGKALAAIQKKMLGPRSVGKLLSVMSFGSYNKRIKAPVNGFAWLSTVDEVCRAYDADPWCGFPFTASGYYDLFSGLMEINSPQWAGKVPGDLPIFIIAGEEDPVGNYGKGPAEVDQALKAAGCRDVTCKLYPGKRHELFNESNRQEVFHDVLAWLDRVYDAALKRGDA